MSTASKALPPIRGWPYTLIELAHDEFKKCHGSAPRLLWIGIDLWMALRNVSDADEFFAMESIPIKLEASGILERNEFLFSV
jgi:hypothetical protein